MNSIFVRRSIRKYTKQEVTDEVIVKLTRAAMSAPSAGNEQPLHFIIGRSMVKNRKERILCLS